MNPLSCFRPGALLLAVLICALSSPAIAANSFPTFTTTQYPIGLSSTRVAIADFNQDGWHDVASLDGKDVIVRLGIGAGKLGDPRFFLFIFFASFLTALVVGEEKTPARDHYDLRWAAY